MRSRRRCRRRRAGPFRSRPWRRSCRLLRRRAERRHSARLRDSCLPAAAARPARSRAQPVEGGVVERDGGAAERLQRDQLPDLRVPRTRSTPIASAHGELRRRRRSSRCGAAAGRRRRRRTRASPPARASRRRSEADRGRAAAQIEDRERDRDRRQVRADVRDRARGEEQPEVPVAERLQRMVAAARTGSGGALLLGPALRARGTTARAASRCRSVEASSPESASSARAYSTNSSSVAPPRDELGPVEQLEAQLGEVALRRRRRRRSG